MSGPAEFLNASDAAKRLGVSAKALRLYEQRGLITPVRTMAGWRTYGPNEMERAAEIVALRALGLSLTQVARVLNGDPKNLEAALAAHQSVLDVQAHELAHTIAKVRELRSSLAQGRVPDAGELARLVRPTAEITAAFDLPWPWGGERFELRDIRPLNYIVGPLGSGKTRLARALAENLPGAIFLGLERLENQGADAIAQMTAHPVLKNRVDQAMDWLVEDGASISPALIALLTALESESILVIDMVEHGLDHPSQEALMAHLRRRRPNAQPLFLMTRSSVILDLGAVTHRETIILCPANHSPPTQVSPYSGAPGYETVATCLASPEIRARTVGVIAWMPPAA